MIFNEASEGTAKNGADFETLVLGSNTKFFLIIPSDTTDKTDRQIWTVVENNVEGEKFRKTVYNHPPNGWFVKMTMDKSGKRGKKAVGQRLAIYLINDI